MQFKVSFRQPRDQKELHLTYSLVHHLRDLPLLVYPGVLLADTQQRVIRSSRKYAGPGYAGNFNKNVYQTDFEGVTWDEDNWLLSTTNLEQGRFQSRGSVANGYLGINVASAGPFFEIDSPDDTNGWPLFSARQSFATISGFFDSQPKQMVPTSPGCHSTAGTVSSAVSPIGLESFWILEMILIWTQRWTTRPSPILELHTTLNQASWSGPTNGRQGQQGIVPDYLPSSRQQAIRQPGYGGHGDYSI